MKFFFIFSITFFYSLLATVVLAHAQSHSGSITEVDKWVLFERRDGVIFYIQHKSSPYDTRYNTMVRLRNTNPHEVTVMFTPSFFCEGDDDSRYKDQNKVRINVYPRHSVTLLAYRPCQGDVPDKITFKEIQINKR